MQAFQNHQVTRSGYSAIKPYPNKEVEIVNRFQQNGMKEPVKKIKVFEPEGRKIDNFKITGLILEIYAILLAIAGAHNELLETKDPEDVFKGHPDFSNLLFDENKELLDKLVIMNDGSSEPLTLDDRKLDGNNNVLQNILKTALTPYIKKNIENKSYIRKDGFYNSMIDYKNKDSSSRLSIMSKLTSDMKKYKLNLEVKYTIIFLLEQINHLRRSVSTELPKKERW